MSREPAFDFFDPIDQRLKHAMVTRWRAYEAECSGIFDPQTSQERQLQELAEYYHDLCEDFDQCVCAQRNERGIAIPTTREEYRAINRNARRVLEDLWEIVQCLDVSRSDWLEAIRRSGGNRDAYR